MTTAVDTNVLLDLLGGEPLLASAARRALDLAVGEGSLVLCPIVYSELAAGFGQGDQLEQFLHDLGLRVDSFSSDALWRAYPSQAPPAPQRASPENLSTR